MIEKSDAGSYLAYTRSIVIETKMWNPFRLAARLPEQWNTTLVETIQNSETPQINKKYSRTHINLQSVFVGWELNESMCSKTNNRLPQ